MDAIRYIPRDTHTLIQLLLTKAREHKVEADALEFRAHHLIATSLNIDLADDNWILDLERGLVIRQEKEPEHANQPAPTPTVAGQPPRRNRKRNHSTGAGDEGDAGTD